MLDLSLDGILWRRPRPVPTEDWRLAMQALLRESVSRGAVSSFGRMRAGMVNPDRRLVLVAYALGLARARLGRGPEEGSVHPIGAGGRQRLSVRQDNRDGTSSVA